MTGIIFAVLLTVMVIFFILQVKQASQSMIVEIVKAKSWENLFYERSRKEKLEDFLLDYKANPDKYSQKTAKKKYKNLKKTLDGYTRARQRYETGKKIEVLDIMVLFGYRMCVMLKLDNESDVLRKVVRSCELSGHIELEKTQSTSSKKNSYIYSYYLLATLISYVYIGVAIALLCFIILPGIGKGIKAAIVMAMVSIAVMTILGYLPLDELSDRANKRTEEIERDFPNVASKMALLYMSGMTIVNALKETADSGNGLIYKELKLVLADMEKADSLEKVLSRLQSRCENKYLDKMVTILASSDVYGNVKLTEDLLALNAECWLEKKHSVRRYVEAVQAKLMVPTMLMLISILIMVIVPVIEGFM